MATKYGPRKKHNAGTIRSSTTTKGGSRTRKTVTVKTGNYTRSRSVNKNGTVRQTTTHKSPSGFWTRKTKTTGSSPSKPKAPKFIKAKPFKAPKLKIFKGSKTTYKSSGRSSRRRSSSSGSYSGGEDFGFVIKFWLVVLSMIFIGFKITLFFVVIYYFYKWLS